MKRNWSGIFLMLLLGILMAACSGKQPSSDTNTTSATSPQEQQVFAAAEVYRDIYESVYPGNQAAPTLTDDTMMQILSALGAQGDVAVDFSNRFAMENASLVLQFLDNMESGTDAHVTIYQICWDGGFVCHDLSYRDGRTSVTLTSLAWLSDGPYALPGDIPTIRYSNEYEVTEIHYTPDGYLEYAYDMPDNPPGTDHDGHIDTVYRIAVAAADITTQNS